MLYTQKINTRTGQWNLVNSESMFHVKESVATHADLPITGNSEDDLRVTKDTDFLWVWTLSASSGLLTDWLMVGPVSSIDWSAITNRPTSTVGNIDDAVTKRHTQGTDQGLDTGGANATTAAQVKQAVTDDHTHSNKTILDSIQEALTTALKSVYDGVVTAFGLHKDATTGVHGVGSGDTLAKFSDITKTNVELPNVTNDKQIKDAIDTYSDKPIPANADLIPLQDSAESGLPIKKLSWTNIKSTLKTYFDALYTAIISVNTTFTVKTSGGDFTTIQDALDYLKNKQINSDVTVTISVDAGLFTHTSAILFRHPNGNRIKIVGVAPIITTITSLNSQSGSAGNYSITLNVANTAGMATGDYCIIRDSTGTGEHRAIMGCWEITNIPSGTQIVVKNTYRKAAFPTLTITGGYLHCLKTILKFNGCDGILPGNGVGAIYNLALVGNGTSYDGINISQRGYNFGNHIIYLGEYSVYSLGINGFGRYGIAQTSKAEVWVMNAAISNCGSYGLYAYSGAVIAGSGIISSGNVSIGIYATDGAFITAVNSFAIGNATVGFYANCRAGINAENSEAVGNVYSGFQCLGTSYLYAKTSKSLNNGYHGYSSSYNGMIYAQSSSAIGNGAAINYYGYWSSNGGHIRADSTTASGNFSGDYFAEHFSFIKVTSYVGTPTFSPAVDTMGNAGSIIRSVVATPIKIADAIKNIPAGSISSTDVQAAINELDTEKTTLAAVKLDADIADAITKKHTQNTDTSASGAFAVTGKLSTGSFATPYAQTVTVAVSGGDYTTITAALASITDAATGKRYCVLVYPGKYVETVTCKAYVDIIGVSQHDVIIAQTNADIVTLECSNVLLKDLTIQITAPTALRRAIYTSSAQTGIVIDNVEYLATGNYDHVFINLFGAITATVRNCSYINATNNKGYFLESNYNTNYASTVTVENCKSSTLSIAFHIGGNGSIFTFRNNLFTSSGNTIFLYNSTGTTTVNSYNGVYITGNFYIFATAGRTSIVNSYGDVVSAIVKGAAGGTETFNSYGSTIGENFDVVGEMSIKVYSQAAEPALSADNRMALWIDSDDSNRVYLLFRRGTGDQVAVELA